MTPSKFRTCSSLEIAGRDRRDALPLAPSRCYPAPEDARSSTVKVPRVLAVLEHDERGQCVLGIVEPGELAAGLPAYIQPSPTPGPARCAPPRQQHAVADDRARRHRAADADQGAIADDAVVDRHVVADGGLAADARALWASRSG